MSACAGRCASRVAIVEGNKVSGVGGVVLGGEPPFSLGAARMMMSAYGGA